MAEPGASHFLDQHSTAARGFSYERAVNELLAGSDVKINGSRAWDIRVHDERFFQRVLGQGTLGVGESYMDGWWDAEDLDGFLFRLDPVEPSPIGRTRELGGLPGKAGGRLKVPCLSQEPG